MPCRRQACGCGIPCPALHAGEPGVSLKLRPPRVPTKVPVKRTCGSGSRHGSSSPARDWCDATALPIHPARGSDRAPSFPGETSGKMRPRHACPPLAALPAPVRRSATNSGTRNRSSRAGRLRLGNAARGPPHRSQSQTLAGLSRCAEFDDEDGHLSSASVCHVAFRRR